MDYTLVRASGICPFCAKQKEVGLVACWSCYRVHELRYGNPEAETLLGRTEARLREQKSPEYRMYE